MGVNLQLAWTSLGAPSLRGRGLFGQSTLQIAVYHIGAEKYLFAVLLLWLVLYFLRKFDEYV